MKNNLCLCVFMIFYGSLYAQNLDPSVIATAGGTHSNSQLSLEWTLGEVAVQTSNISNQIITEGYHQPILDISIFLENHLVSSSKVDFRISVSPNPFKSILNVKIQSEKKEKMFVSVFNLQGEEQMGKLKKNSNDNFEMNLSHLASGIYFLRFINFDGQEVKTFKLNKIN